MPRLSRRAALAAALLLSGCQALGLPADLSLAGGIHEILRRGVHVSYSFPMEDVLPVLPVMPRQKLGPPPWRPQ